MKRRLVFALLLAAACGGGGSSATLVPNFLLADVNSASPTAGQDVSPRDYQGDTSAWFFGDAMTAYAVDQFGLLDRMQDELWIEQRTLLAGQAPDLDALEQIVASAWRVEAADDVHTGRFSRAARAHDCDELADRDAQAHAAQRVHRSGSGPVGLGHVA